MLKTTSIFLLFFIQIAYSQNKVDAKCSIEIFLLKKNYPLYDTATKKMIPFTPILEDLEDTAFIKDSELITYTIKKYIIKNKGRKKYTKQNHIATFVFSLDQRMERLNLPVGLAIQYALVINGQIAYGGHFLYKYVSVNPLGVNAFVDQNEIYLQYSFKGQDPRANKGVIECLRNTKRLKTITIKE